MGQIKLGIIELGYREKIDSLSILEQIINYAIEVENKGFSRFWLAEHHYTYPNHPFSNGEILLTILAGMTERIKVGTAGTSISLYSPYSTATNFKMLNNLYSNRIDLGLSKGIPDSKLIMKLANEKLNVDTSFKIFDENLKSIVDLFNNEEKNLKEHNLLIPPLGGSTPDLWYLSGSYRSFDTVIEHKLNFCRSIFHGTGRKIEHKKEELLKCKSLYFEKNGHYPEVALALAVYIGDTIEEATKKVDDFIAETKANAREAFNIIPTTIDLMHEMLLSYQDDFGIDEFIIYDFAVTNEAKIKNVELISEKFNLLALV
ncbi:LLM class flavin-dependent oxidoreductase [Psychroserpens luteolus]|uniref:LLM class flavin-dependent oxidoreductase n=1 Tax=Psychroserpens luteolus TaxID=2855840 RepID=UPI001E309F3E|nr:LLM class flavin-dependent oxidoreductase [Psychroserpens luteolus]MCD2258061.1 LLM class flavin-dependent oxidoreductase [Psychroserpens luteolus]